MVRAWSKRAPDEDSPINHAASENRTWKLGPPKSRRSRHVVVRGEDARRLHDVVAASDPTTTSSGQQRETPGGTRTSTPTAGYRRATRLPDAA